MVIAIIICLIAGVVTGILVHDLVLTGKTQLVAKADADAATLEQAAEAEAVKVAEKL